MQRFTGGNSLPEFEMKGGAWEYWLQAYQHRSKMPVAAAMTKKMMLKNVLATKYNDSPLKLEFGESMSDADRRLLLQSKQLRAAQNGQWKQDLFTITMTFKAKYSMMVTQKDKEMEEQKKRVIELARLLKEVQLEKEKWEKLARKMSVMVTAFHRTLKQAEENNVSCQSSAPGDVIREEEVASNFCSNPREDEEEAEPAAKRKKLGGPHQWRSSSSSLCKLCRSNFASVVLLPCRHCCLCKLCGPLRRTCPLCQHVINEEIEIFLS